MLRLELEYDEGILFARLNGKLTRRTSYKINNYLNPLLEKHKIKLLIYNFDKLKEIDNIGIEALIRSKNYMKKNKGKIRSCFARGNMEYVAKYLRFSYINNEREAYKLMEAKKIC